MTICPLCFSSLEDQFSDDHENIICHSCGLVVSESQFSASITDQSSGSTVFTQPYYSSYKVHKHQATRLPKIKKAINGLCTALEIPSSIASECITISKVISDTCLNGRLPKPLFPASLYIVTRQQHSFPLTLSKLSSISGDTPSAIMRIVNKYHFSLSDSICITKSPSGSDANAFNDADHVVSKNPFTDTMLVDFMRLCRVFVQMLTKEVTPFLSLETPLPHTSQLLDLIKLLYRFTCKYTLILEGRKPEIALLAHIYIVLYSFLGAKSAPTFLTNASKLFGLTKRRVLTCSNEILESVLSKLPNLGFSVHEILIYLPSVLPFAIIENKTSTRPKKLPTETDEKITRSISWINSMRLHFENCSQAQGETMADFISSKPAGLSSQPPLTLSSNVKKAPIEPLDIDIRYLLLNSISADTIHHLTADGIHTLAGSLRAAVLESIFKS